MRVSFLIVCACALLANSCAFPSQFSRTRMIYVGKFYPPSMRVDVLYDERDIKTTRYEFMGEIGWTGFFIQKDDYGLLEYALVEEAKTRGADAMIVTMVPLFDTTVVRHTVRVRLLKYLL